MTFGKIFLFALLLLAPSLGDRLVESSLSEELGQPLDVILDELDPDDSDDDLGRVNSARPGLSATLNPGCPAPLCSSPNVTVANLTSPHSGEDNDDQDDSMMDHRWTWAVLGGAVGGGPTLHSALTRANETDGLVVDWARLVSNRRSGESKSDSIQYEREAEYEAALMLAGIIECQDSSRGEYEATPPEEEDKTAKAPPDCLYYPMEALRWRRTVFENGTEKSGRVSYNFVGENFTVPEGHLNDKERFGLRVGNMTGGKVNLTFSAYPGVGFGAWLPHLSHSESTNQVDIQLMGLETSSGFNRSRFHLDLFLAASEGKGEGEEEEPYGQHTETLDDEHTPGIFVTHELVVPGPNSSLRSYLQWRPVVYCDTARDLQRATGVNVTVDKVPDVEGRLRGTVLDAMFGRRLHHQGVLVRRVGVALGKDGDGGYGKTKYQAWTFTMGTGDPIHNGVSPFLLLAFTALLGGTVLVCVAALGVHVLRKANKAKTRTALHGQEEERREEQRRRLQQYVTLNNEE